MRSTLTSSPPLTYLRIKLKLQKRLDTDWPAGARLPAMPQLAQLLDAGQTNTHRAVQALVAEGRLVTRRGAGTFVAPLDGEPITAGRGSKPSVAGKKIVIIASQSEPGAMVASMLTHAGDVLRAHDAEVEIRGLRLSHVGGWIPSDFDAAVVINPDSYPTIHYEDRQMLTIISTGSDLSVASSKRYDVVGVDQEQAGYVAGEWARSVDATRPCFVGVHIGHEDDFDCTGMMRLRGFEQGFGSPVMRGDRFQRKSYGPMNGALAAAKFVIRDPRPDVVFCASDELAVGFAMGASAHGLEVGRDYRLIGFDRQQFGREMAAATLTTIEVPAAEMGRRAGEMLVSRFENPDQPVRRLAMGCKLAVGTT